VLGYLLPYCHVPHRKLGSALHNIDYECLLPDQVTVLRLTQHQDVPNLLNESCYLFGEGCSGICELKALCMLGKCSTTVLLS
jgi:hypothetical protein